MEKLTITKIALSYPCYAQRVTHTLTGRNVGENGGFKLKKLKGKTSFLMHLYFVWKIVTVVEK